MALKTKNAFWLWLFAALAATEIFAEISGKENLVFFSKPLLMPVLAVWFFRETAGRKLWLRLAVVVALVFSAIGDSLLMFAGGHSGAVFFIAGLAAFLFAHVFYISGFHATRSLSNGYIRRNLAVVPFFGLYLLGLLTWLWPGIPAEMRLPVSVYALVITLMAVSVLNLRGAISENAWQWVLAGALLFVLSDSLIALNKFGQPFAGARAAIMLTYVFGQYLIVRGVARAF